jgi:peroxiredoxin Q/BCP
MTRQLAVGDKAPDFTLPDMHGKPVSRSDLAGRRVVLYFFPKAFTSGCTTEACDFRDQLPRFRDQGVAVIGISRDTPDVLKDFAREHELGFLLLSDVDRSVHAAYGVLGTAEVDGVPKEKVIRSTFVIAPDATIESAQYGVSVPGHVSSLLC